MFFYVFFLSNPPGAGMFWEQKDHFVPDATQAEEIQKSASTELHEQSENVVNVENQEFLKENCEFVSVIYLSKMRIVSMFYSSTVKTLTVL